MQISTFVLPWPKESRQPCSPYYRRVHARESTRLYPRASCCLNFFGQGSTCKRKSATGNLRIYEYTEGNLNTLLNFNGYNLEKNLVRQNRRSPLSKGCQHVWPWSCVHGWVLIWETERKGHGKVNVFSVSKRLLSQGMIRCINLKPVEKIGSVWWVDRSPLERNLSSLCSNFWQSWLIIIIIIILFSHQ